MVDSTWNRLNLMIQQGKLNPMERIQLLLSSGLDTFHMDIAGLTRLEDDYLTVVFSNKTSIQGQQFSMYQTLCQFTIQHEGVIADSNLENTDWESYGILEGLRFAAYMGVPIYIEKQIYGTLFFASHSPRTHEFSAREQAYLQIMESSLRNLVHQQAFF